MPPANEVEIKFLVSDSKALEERLSQLGFRQQTPSTHEMNSLYDTPELTLRSRGEIVRIRKFGDIWKLTHKSRGESGKHKNRVEHETAVEDGQVLDGILRAVGYEPRFVYEKYRAEWTDGFGHVVVDRTPIGDVAEIEGPPEWIDSTARRLGLAEADYITKSYADLFADWKRRTGSKAKNMTFQECGTPLAG